jgi:hypothetical protein
MESYREALSTPIQWVQADTLRIGHILHAWYLDDVMLAARINVHQRYAHLKGVSELFLSGKRLMLERQFRFLVPRLQSFPVSVRSIVLDYPLSVSGGDTALIVVGKYWNLAMPNMRNSEDYGFTQLYQ